jgi:hypothetical protein
MSKSNAFESDMLGLILHGISIPGIADNAVSSPLTVLYVALHIGTVLDTHDQSTNEFAGGGYARQAIPRDATGFQLISSFANPFPPYDILEFPEKTSGAAETVGGYSLGTAATGAGEILYYSGVTGSAASISIGQAPVLDFDSGNTPIVVET